MNDRFWVGILLGLALAYAYSAFMVPRGAPALPIVVRYDRTGEATAGGVAYNWTNAGR